MNEKVACIKSGEAGAGEEMVSEKYREHQSLLLMTAKTLSSLPLEEMLKAIDRAEIVGPILDPTLYRDGAKGMSKVKRIAEAALTVKEVIKKIEAEEQSES